MNASNLMKALLLLIFTNCSKSSYKPPVDNDKLMAETFSFSGLEAHFPANQLCKLVTPSSECTALYPAHRSITIQQTKELR